MESIPKCQHCGSLDRLQINTRYKRKDGRVNTYYMCRPCSTERQRAYRATERGAARVYSAVRKYQKRSPERVAAWGAAKKMALQPCQICGTSEHVHRHHDDPAKKLEVVFLCAFHHKQRHAELNAAKAAV